MMVAGRVLAEFVAATEPTNEVLNGLQAAGDGQVILCADGALRGRSKADSVLLDLCGSSGKSCSAAKSASAHLLALSSAPST